MVSDKCEQSSIDSLGQFEGIQILQSEDPKVYEIPKMI